MIVLFTLLFTYTLVRLETSISFPTVHKSKFKHPKLAYLSVFGGFLVQLTLGGVYTYGNMAPYMLQYMRNNTAPYKYINVGNSVWIFGLCVFGLGATMSFGGFIEYKLGTSFTILLGSLIMSFGVLITYWTIQVHLALVAISYGLIVGLGVGLAYGLILGVPNLWFPDSKGLVTGIVVAGFGIGPIIFDFIQAYYINHDLHNNKLSEVNNLRYSFILMAGIYAAIQIIGSLMIKKPPAEKPTNEFSINDNFSKYVAVENYKISLKTHELLFERDFWILWITYMLNSVVAILVLSLHKTFGFTLKITDLYLTYFTASGAFANGIGRVIWGILNDRIPYKVLMSSLSLCMSLMLGTFYLCVLAGSSNKPESGREFMYCVWVIVLHFLLSGNFTLFPTICAKTFGSEHFAGNYGLLFTAYSFGGIVTSAVTTKLLENEHSIAFLTPFLVGCGLSFLSSGVTLFYRGKSLMYYRDGCV